MLLRWIREVADEPLVVDPAARNIEARENTWSLSTSIDERGSLSAHEVVAAFEECASILRERVRSLGYDGQVTFYVWHDQQAGQLRCSTASLPGDELPFRSRVELDVPLAAIAEEFLDDARPGQGPWDDLRPASDGYVDETQPDDFVVRVWTADIGGTQ
ncbi:hypothetical protein F4560_001090 [Saccharothrix ecbatanensis]|uniref:Uncharacterized protein n=1 Tax=Saccharothrix ecbatanensis TaxID=1105145 RepID=A0A7W9HFJ4_9PSEU|nr:hypothetical protein [Saccharothrix ecbatanensis]MBB5801322.1 hypothetical protein [Saccharothrix ecbatanensis]